MHASIDLFKAERIADPDGTPTLAFMEKWQRALLPIAGTVTQATSRTTGVTLDATAGSITLYSAAGSTSWATFTVTNEAVHATDVPIVVQASGTDDYRISVTRVVDGAFDITFSTTGGTTSEQPVFNFILLHMKTL